MDSPENRPPVSPPPMPQPPPRQAAPAPPAKPGMQPATIVMICLGVGLLFIVAIAAVTGLVAPLVLRSKKKAEQVTSLNNARQVGMGLMEFEIEYGRMPDAETAPEVARSARSGLAPPGTTANDHLRQLLAAGIVQGEDVFYAKTTFSRRPDNQFGTSSTALAPGELGFGYMLNGDVGLQSTLGHKAVVLCAPLAITGSTVSHSRFDPGIFNGKAVMLHLDLSARHHPIDRESGNLIIEGNPWLATGEGTIWGADVTPRTAVPEPH